MHYENPTGPRFSPPLNANRRRDDRSSSWTLGLRLLAITLMIVLGASSAGAQLALPYSSLATPLSLGTDVVFTIDLGTLTQRPVLEVEAIPDAGHADLELEIELTNFSGFAGPPAVCAERGPYGPLFGVPLVPGSSFVSDPAIGTQTIQFDFAPCFPESSVYAGTSVDVRVRVLDLGSGGAGPSADISILSRTAPPFSEFFAPATGPRTLIIDAAAADDPFKDTTIYEDNPAASNGQGEFLWSGTEVTPLPNWGFQREERRALMAIDFTGRLPVGSTIDEVELVLEATSVLGGGGTVSLHEVAIDPLQPWIEGNVDALGDEFDGANQSPAANWIYRRATTKAWQNPGGDFETTALASQAIVGPGSYSFSSPALAQVVEDMIAIDEDEDGFLLQGPGSSATQTEAVQFASSESAGVVPQMFLTYTPPDVSSQGEFLAGTLSFIDEGENLRWVYDFDNDDILITPIDGVCEVDTSGGDLDVLLPYTYDYNGTPGYVGYDCCMWQITSSQSQVVGTGQAIFFHNLDANDPANLPPDTDGDGIRDVCDNCVFTANGPLLGSCATGPTIGALCVNDLQCGTGGVCDLSQTDDDLDQVGNACPEPGFAMLLGCGILAVASVGRRSRPAGDPR